MLLLTGATGLVGSSLLRRLVADGTPVRCLVRDPRRLGAQRVRVQIALGDLTDPPSFRNALRGVRTVVHLASSIRDQPSGSIEELDGIATWRMVEAAERAGVECFLFFSALDASTHHRARVFRAKALAEQAVREASLRSIVFAPSLIYAPGDRLLTLLERLCDLGGGRADAGSDGLHARHRRRRAARRQASAGRSRPRPRIAERSTSRTEHLAGQASGRAAPCGRPGASALIEHLLDHGR